MTKFPYDYVIKIPEKEVWIKCNSSITAMGIGTLIDKYFPGYTGHIASVDYFKTLTQEEQ